MLDIVLTPWNILSDSDHSCPHCDIFKHLLLLLNLAQVLPLFPKSYLDKLTAFSFENPAQWIIP